MTRRLPWGKDQSIEVLVPPRWKVVLDHRAAGRPAIENFPESVKSALTSPSFGPPLSELAKGAGRVVIVIDDVGRPTPARLMAPAVLDALVGSGIEADRITVVFAVGTHRPMRENEMREKAGDEVVDRVQCINHNCRDASLLEHFGRTSFGTPVSFNRLVAEADLRVLIGTIEPHPQAGFGGGLKNLLPGCASAAAIGHNHLVLPSPDRWNMIGVMPEDNPMRLDIEEAAAMLSGKNFILNTILGPGLQPVALVSGDAIAAHRRGVEIARGLYGARLERRVDAAIVSSFPMDVDLRQGVKGLANFPGAVKKGGAIICFLECARGMENIKLPGWVPPAGPMRALLKLLGSRGIYGLTKRLPARVPAEARFIINFGLQMLKDHHLMIFSPRLARETGGKLREFFFDDQDAMFARAERLLKTSSPEACIIAEGGVSFPIVEG